MVSVRILCLALVLGVSSSALAEDIREIFNLALTNDPQVKQANSAFEAALESRRQARANFLPNINLSADTTYNEQNREFGAGSAFGGDENFNSRGFTLSLTQPVYRHESYIEKRQSDAVIAEAEANLGSAEQSLIVRVAESYFNVLAAEDNFAFAKSEIEAIARQLEQTNERFEVGLIAITDVNEAQASYDLAVADQIEAENLRFVTREALREITNEYHESLSTLIANTPLLSPDPNDIEKWVSVALEENLSIIAAEFAAENQRHNIDRIKSTLHPTLDLVVSQSTNISGGGSLGGSEIDSSAIGLQFNYPIYAGGGVFSQTREAKALYDQSNQALEQQRRNTVRQVRESYLGVLASISRVKALQQAEKSSKSALEANEVGLEVGTRTTVDVLDSRRTLFRAKRDLARARYDYILNTLRLKQAAGTLSPADIREVNKWLS